MAAIGPILFAAGVWVVVALVLVVFVYVSYAVVRDEGPFDTTPAVGPDDDR